MRRFVLLAAVPLACSATGAACGREGLPPLGQVPDATVAEARFPLAVRADGRVLVDASGRPFLVHGEAAWSLVVQLTVDEALRYLDDRAARGVNTLMVNLIEHRFSADPPRNRAGEAPFTGGFGAPNPAYFDHADRVLAAARARGMLVLLYPAYLGFDGGDEGWFREMSAAPAPACRAYGEWLGTRYAAATNLVWMAGGDYTPPAGSSGERCMLELMAGLDATDPDSLRSAHWAPESSSLTLASFRSRVQLDGVYTYKQVHPACRDARAAATMPVFLIESTYENERDVTQETLRRQAYEGVLECGAGQIFGNRPIWLFDAGWPSALGGPGSRSQEHLLRVFAERRWYDLRPSREVVAAGSGAPGSDSYVSAARSDDGRLAILYLPAAAPRAITVDLAALAGSLVATWIDPRDGTATGVAGPPFPASGTRELTAPRAGDWVLVLENR